MSEVTEDTNRLLPQPRSPIGPFRDVGRHPIARAAADSSLHPQTLRDYERRGLLLPARTAGGKRLYSDADVIRARRIRRHTEAGVPLRVVRRLLRLEDILQTAFERIRVLEDQNRRLSGRLHQLELAIDRPQGELS